MYYLIIKVSHTNPTLITKFIVLGIQFKISGKISFASDGIAKPKKKIKPSQHIPKQSKN